MNKFLRHFLFSISLIACASVYNLKSEDPGDMDFLDKLLKEIEEMENKEKDNKNQYQNNYSSTTTSEPFSMPTSTSSSQETKIDTLKPLIKKDTKTLFLQPDVEDVKRGGKGTKKRPTKDTILAFKYYSNELNTTSRDITNKLELNQSLPPKFKESKLRDFRQELETTNALLDLIKDKGIYYANFLKAGNDKKEKKYDSESPASTENKNVRKDLLDILKKLQNLNSSIPTPDESKESDIELIQKIAEPEQKSALPKYIPLAPKTKPATKETFIKTKPIEQENAEQKDITDFEGDK